MFAKFADFDKAPKDVFKKDFDSEGKILLKINTKGPSGLGIESAIDFCNPKEIKATSAFKLQLGDEGKYEIDKIEVKNDNITFEGSLKKPIPDLNVTFKATKNSSKDKKEFTSTISCLYEIARTATITADMDIANFPPKVISASVTSGMNNFTAGGEYTPGAYAGGVGYKIDNVLFVGARANSTVSTGYLPKDFGLNFLYTVNPKVSVAGDVSVPKNAVKFAATYQCHANTDLKFKLESSGILAASVKQTLNKQAKQTITGAFLFNLQSGEKKFGVTASLG